jgi:DNA polymerase-3 subunit epsilon
MRQVVLDTETTGLEPAEGHRIIEIGAVELLGGQPTGEELRLLLDPEREMDADAVAVHGYQSEDLAGRPRFRDVAEPVIEFLRDAEVLIHFAEFDLGFINRELALLGPGWGELTDYCRVTCTRELAIGFLLELASHRLDALCDHYGIDRSHRERHGALIDARLLAAVYAAMCAGKGVAA